MRRYFLILGIAGIVALLDQCTKLLVLKNLPAWSSISVVEGFFNLVHVHNRGAAFGFLNRSDIEWQFWLFAAVTLFAVVIVFYLARTAPARSTAIFLSLGLILGGAAGNFIDRARLRYVIDFLDFYFKDKHWPAFNVADIAICVGAVLLILITLRQKNNEPEKTGR